MLADEAEEDVDELLAAVARIPPRPIRSDSDWMPPAELDEYRLIRPIGRGGMGSVWLAEDRLLERLVAVKFIAHAQPDKRTRERFALEARAAARLTHPNVVTVHRYGEIAERPYLVSEYIRGESLDKLAKPIDWQRALEIGLALARGLAAAHRHGIVHRDIKPANAILTADGEAKLVDFGLAKLDHERETHGRVRGIDMLTHAGTIAGTPRYLAPEVRRGEAASRRSDVYQLGSILYELVTGRAPIEDLLAQQAETAPDGVEPADCEANEVPSLAERFGANPDSREGARFAAVVARCLRRDLDERFASGDELREALEQLHAPARTVCDVPVGNPYRGLVPFEAEHRALFFGRDAEIRSVVERLRSESFVLVTGDSGVGKSSLCRAGVLPRIADGRFGDRDTWRTIQLVPGQRPLSTLASLLAETLDVDEEQLLATLRDRPSAIGRELRRAGGSDHGLVVFVDQLEEISTIAERSEADPFAAVLAELAGGTPGLRLLATVRSDFLTRVAELPSLGGEIARAIYLLRPLTAEGAREAIVGPARATGVRFESDALVEALVGSVVEAAESAKPHTAVELPLLAFTLAHLWDARDLATDEISARSLDTIGGVKGALARHADGVLDSLLPDQRAAARKILLRLVTAERTRVRRAAGELAAFDRAALDALVRGRLVVARGGDAPICELAHERLIDGWPTFATWIAETTDALAVHARVAAAVAEWDRLERPSDHLWSARQIAELAIIAAEDLTAGEIAFVRASQRALRRRRWIRGSMVAGVLLAIVSLYTGAKLVARRDLERHVSDRLGEAAELLERARFDEATAMASRAAAVARFDAGDPGAEAEWRRSQRYNTDARTRYSEGAHALEQAFVLDPSRDDIRTELARVTFERMQIAERWHREAERAELATRIRLYDTGLFAHTAVIPAYVTLSTNVPATVRILDANGRAPAATAHLEVPAPGTIVARVSPGSYVIEAQAAGRAIVRDSVLLRAEEHRALVFALPPADAIPKGFVYIPAGRFRYGSSDDEEIRAFFVTTPMHEVETGAYLISSTEVTFAEWFRFLDELDADERERRTPRVPFGSNFKSAGIELRTLRDGKREITFAPASMTFTAREGEMIEYPDRQLRRNQDWRRFPVSGVSSDDAEAYAAWLDRKGLVRHARLCTEHEWERAARGADGRPYPHGARLEVDDANIDTTYGQRPGAFGFDEVGSHPASTSPFGVHDMLGNAWEVAKAKPGPGLVLRGGNYYMGFRVGHVANREPAEPSYRQVPLGVRICADAP